ncbi:arylsulfatase [Bacteroides xylanisolvens]|uniref:Arylsulfatase n=1 Tax=Bacteroides xylanisolvens TaxID=371601 RepID=A0A1Y4VNA9_9BACE|nr:arylsulfatase [Bacteroides xylanisolvens]OUQ71617.1 arylsulfatase [Bacteroides xylanisolvens]
MKQPFILTLMSTVACTATATNKAPENTTPPQSNTPPNILFILCDDMGYGDLGCYGQPFIRTPHIDTMANEGMRFTQAYAGSPVSAPSRASFMTGQHSGHCEVRGNKEYWKNVPIVLYGQNQEYSIVGQHPYDSDHVILPEIMKDNGYTTGMFGKWAGGYEGSRSTPDKREIDEYYGYICQFQAHLYYPNFLNRYSKALGDTGVVRVVMDENIKYPMYGPDYQKRPQYSADMIHQKALEWLDQQDDKQPFFGILTYTLPHAELVQPEDSILNEYKAKFNPDKEFKGSEGSRYNAITHTHAQFAGMITRLDYYVGEVLKKLKEKGLDENTLVIFSSDNGPHEEGGADPTFFGRDGKLRGLKRQCHEGGIRIPFIARWPGHIPAGKVNDHICAFYDLMPTFCEVIGIKDYEKKYRNKEKEVDYFDGISFAPTLLGKKKQKKHDFLYWEFDETDQIAVRMDDWKMVVKKGTPFLYNLKTDIHEDTDIALQHPDVVEKMKAIIFEQHTPNPYFSVTLPKQ